MKFRKSIFTRLIINFIVYAVSLVLFFMAALVIQSAVISGGDFQSMDPYQLIADDGTITDTEILKRLGGWAEELDDQHNVLSVYGEKKTEDMSYTAQSLLELTSGYTDTEYISLYIPHKESGRKYLFMYDRAIMELKPSVIVNDIEKYGTPDIVFPVFLLLAAAATVTAGNDLRKRIKRPLDSIIDGMNRLKSGSENARIDVKTEAEFEQIVNTFNEMSASLSREKAEKEQMIKQKNRTLLELSHDLKTPVATIKSYANALEQGLVPEDRIKSIYRTIDIKADRVKKLTDDMFMMLKMDNPDYRLNTESVDLCELMRRLCSEYYDQLYGAGFEFEISIPDEPVTITADPDLYSRIISNLLSNAEKYNKTGKNISVRVYLKNGHGAVDVSDDGEEISPVFAAAMFEPFSRGDIARKTDGGTGLGLAISKIIAEKHGGTIEYIRSNGKNIFTVVI